MQVIETVGQRLFMGLVVVDGHVGGKDTMKVLEEVVRQAFAGQDEG